MLPIPPLRFYLRGDAMFQKLVLACAFVTLSFSSASAQTSSNVTPTLHQDTQVYLSDISSVGIEMASDKIRHRIFGNVTYTSSRCVAPGSRCVGLPAPQPSIIVVEEGAKASHSLFAICRRVIESARPSDRFVLQADFERTDVPVASRPELRIMKLTSCFNYRSVAK